MPPEQLAGADVDARADQFAFAAAMWEALFGVRPFGGQTPEEVKAAVESKPPSPGGDASQRKVPRHLVAALQRALAADRAARWPDLATLLVALRHDPEARRRRFAIVAGALALGVAGTTAAVVLTPGAAAPSPCEGGHLELDTRMPALDGAYARESIPRITGTLDRYAADWEAIQKSSCLAHQRGEVSTAAYDRRTACLARRRAAVTAMTELTRGAGAADLAGLVIAVGSLPRAVGVRRRRRPAVAGAAPRAGASSPRPPRSPT